MNTLHSDITELGHFRLDWKSDTPGLHSLSVKQNSRKYKQQFCMQISK